MPTVSVIIPAYNCANTIEETLQSVFTQENIRFEIIIINDGSTDNTAEVINGYNHLCRIIHTENRGAAAARQTGLSYATGDFIQYLDADDLLMPDKFFIQVNALKADRSDIAYSDWQRFSKTENRILSQEINERILPEKPALALFTDHWWPPAALLFRRSMTEKLSWSMHLPVIQDARYMLDAALARARFVHTPGVLALYRSHQQQSLSQKSEKAFVMDCFANARDMFVFWKNDADFDGEKKAAILRVLRFAINRLTILHPQQAKEAISLLMQVSPGYIPPEKGALRILSKLFGYPHAEAFAGLKRRLQS